MLTLVLLAQLTTYPTAAPASRPVELPAAEPVRAKTLSEVVAERKGSLVLPTVAPAVRSPTPEPLPTIEPAPMSALLAGPSPRPTAAPKVVTPVPPREETPRFPAGVVIGLAAFVAVVVAFVFFRRSGPRPTPVARKPVSAARPVAAPPTSGPAPRIPNSNVGCALEWRWGGNVGQAEELEVVGARFQQRFLRRWGSQEDVELAIDGDSSVRAAIDRLVDRIVGHDAISGSFDAWLKPEPGHTHDAKIVAVIAVVRPDFIELVGHLPKAEVVHWQPPLLELERAAGRGFLAQGRVIKARREGEAPVVQVLGGIGLVEETLAAATADNRGGSAGRGGARRGPFSR